MGYSIWEAMMMGLSSSVERNGMPAEWLLRMLFGMFWRVR